MTVWRLGEQRPPEARPVRDGVVMRFDHVYEVDPQLMPTFPQQDMPAWDTKRLVDGRWDHLEWIHDHFADEVIVAGEPSETSVEHGEE
jgi:hypothetical protein